MRILWVGKASLDGNAGDEIFDRKTVSALKRHGHHVTVLPIGRVSRAREAANLLLGLPHHRARFTSPVHRHAVSALGAQHDVTICSWEPLDAIARSQRGPVILVLHNVTSLAMRQMFPRSSLARLASIQARFWEGRLYRRRHVEAIAVLSRSDRDRIASLADAPPVTLTIPGMPAVVPLEPGAELRRELVLSGTFDWKPKRRDVLLFLDAYWSATDRLALWADDPSILGSQPGVNGRLTSADCGRAIRFGVITDRFVAGHKLKTLSHIAHNQIVLSFADVLDDFAHIEDAGLFIRRVRSFDDIARQVTLVAQMDPVSIRSRFLAFQGRCSSLFTWDAVAGALSEMAERIVGDRSGSAAGRDQSG